MAAPIESSSANPTVLCLRSRKLDRRVSRKGDGISPREGGAKYDAGAGACITGGENKAWEAMKGAEHE